MSLYNFLNFLWGWHIFSLGKNGGTEKKKCCPKGVILREVYYFDLWTLVLPSCYKASYYSTNVCEESNPAGSILQDKNKCIITELYMQTFSTWIRSILLVFYISDIDLYENYTMVNFGLFALAPFFELQWSKYLF